MYGLLTYAALAVAAVSSVSGYAVPRASPPKGWATNYLEDYNVYHTRYLALGCREKHNTAFFDSCCHPLLATETLASARPKQCIPSASASASASAAEPTSTDDGDDDCNDGPTSTTELVSKPTTTAKAVTTHKTTTTHKPTTTTHKATTTKTTVKATATGKHSDIGVTHTGGFATFFEQNGVKGACEKLHKDSDFVVALDSRLYGNTGRVSPDCGREVLIKNPANGHTVKAIVADACPTCSTKQSLDLSHAAFRALAAFSVGEMPITWEFTT